MVTRENEPGCPVAERGSLADLKATPAYGPMHLCRFGSCEIWVADGGDHRCILHSADPYAIAIRQHLVGDLVAGLVDQRLCHVTAIEDVRENLARTLRCLPSGVLA